MSSTQFVEMYHPLIPSTITSPALVPMQAVDDRAAKGWLLVDPDEVLPTPDTPYYTTAAADSRFAKVDDLDAPGTLTGDTLRAAVGTVHPITRFLGSNPATWSAQILGAMEDFPGGTFFFPDGEYGLSDPLDVVNDNSIVLAPNARIYPTEAMPHLINHETGKAFPVRDFHELPQNRLITGGWLDGAGLADTVLRCAVFQGLKVENLQITDGIHRGLVVDKNKLGTSDPNMTAEGIFRGLHFMQTTDDHLTDNVAIEALASDNHFYDTIVIDWTTGIRDLGSNLWVNPHCWTSQVARYATSVAYDVQSSPRMVNPYSDTYRTGWKIGAGFGPMITAPLFLVSNEFVTAEMNSASPSTVFDLASATTSAVTSHGGGLARNYPGGTGAGQTTFIRNPSPNTNIDGVHLDSFPDPPAGGLVPGAPGDYRRGRLLGRNADFSPTIVGEGTAGTVTYSEQTGWMTVYRDRVNLVMRIGGTFGATIAGRLLIPVPVSPTLASVARIGSNLGFPSQLMAHIDPFASAIVLQDQSTASLAGGGSSNVTGEMVQGHAFYLEIDIDLNIAYFA